MDRLQDAEDVLKDMEELIQQMEERLEDGDGRELRAILRRFLGDGRTVTWTLRHLKSEAQVGDFEAWWAGAMRELTTDPLSSFLYKLRNPAVKEGRVDLASQLRVPEMGAQWLTLPKGPDAPEPGAPAAEVMAYMARAPDWTPGCETVSYPMLRMAVELRLELVGTPEPYAGHRIPDLMRRHVAHLRVVLTRCWGRFGGPAAPPAAGPAPGDARP